MENVSSLSNFIQGYNWHTETPDGKNHPVVVETRTVVYPQLEVGLLDDRSKIPMRVFIRK